MTTVIVTRPQARIESTTAVYLAAGLEVFKAPCFATRNNEAVDVRWLDSPADALVILSVPALEHATALAPKWQPQKNIRVIAVGPAVAKVWRQHFEHAIESHPLMNSEGVIQLLKKYQPQAINILTVDSGRDLIKRFCLSERISYTQINTYLREPLRIDLGGLAELYQDGKQDSPILTATSSGILKHFLSQLTAEIRVSVLSAPLVVGAKRIAQFAESIGFNQVHVANETSDAAMCERVLSLL